MAVSDPLIGSLVSGRYRVIAKLGEGGMGAVYVARQEPLGREVALKVMKRSLKSDGSVSERFLREATALSQVSHPNVVTIFDFGVDDGRWFLAMELLRGESLRERIATCGPQLPATTLPIIRDVASGLAVVHAARVVHRDLKPDNIMLLDAGVRAKILDFGVAKMADTPALTKTGVVVGTPGYLAPEHILHGTSDDPRIDLYALGVIWFEALTGSALFDGDTSLEIVKKHVTEKPRRPSELVAGISPELDDLVLRLLSKNPEKRPASAQALIGLIDNIRDTGSSLAEAPTLGRVPILRPSDEVIAAASAPTMTEVDIPRPTPKKVPLAALALVAAVIALVVAVATRDHTAQPIATAPMGSSSPREAALSSSSSPVPSSPVPSSPVPSSSSPPTESPLAPVPLAPLSPSSTLPAVPSTKSVVSAPLASTSTTNPARTRARTTSSTAAKTPGASEVAARAPSTTSATTTARAATGTATTASAPSGPDLAPAKEPDLAPR